VIAYYSDHFVLPLPAGHRFPMAKYARLRERLVELGARAEDDAGCVGDAASMTRDAASTTRDAASMTRDAATNAPAAGILLRVPPAASEEELCLAHDPAYVAAVAAGRLDLRAQREIGFPWSPAMVERSRRSVGATIAAARSAARDHVAVNLAGGTHHAHRARGEGYCVFNDVAVAARVVLREGLARRVLVVDLDVHQGNGTASIFAGDPEVFTLSLHGAGNYPFAKAESDIDIALVDGTDDLTYLRCLDDALGEAFARARPDFVFYLAGVDPFAGDLLGRLALSSDGLHARDRRVFEAAARVGGAGAPVVVTMAGGYARDVDVIADLHLQTVLLARQYQRGEALCDEPPSHAGAADRAAS
jgi:acetoin utilization deacetylase AcuC-like enzyme